MTAQNLRSVTQAKTGMALWATVFGLAILGAAAGLEVGHLSSDDCTTVTVTLADGSTEMTETCS